jgi:hypothetical protein
MTVPETPIYDYNRSISWKNNVRTAWESVYVKPEPTAHFVKNRPHLALRGRVPTANAGHIPAATFARQSVCHRELRELCLRSRCGSTRPGRLLSTLPALARSVKGSIRLASSHHRLEVHVRKES